MQPHGTVAAVFEQQLVEVHVAQDPAVVGTARLHIGDTDIDGLAAEVLGAAHAVDAIVDGLRTKSAVDEDGAELLAQRLQEHLAQVLQRQQLQGVGCVVHSVTLSPGRACHLVVTEMFSQHKIFSFHRHLNF